MHTVSTSYSFTSRCDIRTGLSIGLSILAVLITAVVLGLLAYKECISPTIAYSAAPAIGAVLLLMGAAIACIRKEEPIEPILTPPNDSIAISPMDIQEALKSSAIPIRLTVDLLYPQIDYYPPDRSHLNAYFTVPITCVIHDKMIGINVEIEEIKDSHEKGWVDLTFVYENVRYQKQAQVWLVNPTPICSSLATVILGVWECFRKTFLSKKEYTSLTTDTNPSNHTETLFWRGSNTHFTYGKEIVTISFAIPDVEHGSAKENIVTFVRLKTAEPVRSLQGLEDQPELIKKLQATEWTWKAPYHVKTVNVTKDGCEVICERMLSD